jgi:branched-chain amino acid transport system substrate-binding protein
MRSVFTATLAVLVLTLTSIAGAQAEPIRIGLFGSETGGTATFGVSTKEGVLLALDEINSKGGVLGRQIQIISEDDQSKPEEAKTAVEKLINRDKVVALIGEVASSRSLAAAPVAQAAGIPMLSPSSTNPKVTQVGDCIFRACFIDPFQGSAMAKYALGDLKLKKFAILYDVKNDYSVGLKQFFSEYVKANGGEILTELGYSEGDTDFKAQLTKIRKAKPEAIYVPGYYTEVGSICKQARQLGITVPLMGGDGWDSDKTAEMGGDAINGCFFTNHYSPEDQSPAVQDFVRAYKSRYNGKLPDAMAILGYDSMKIMADAIVRAGSADPKAIRNALATTKDFRAASAVITIDENRNARKAIVVLKIENRVFRFVQSIAP